MLSLLFLSFPSLISLTLAFSVALTAFLDLQLSLSQPLFIAALSFTVLLITTHAFINLSSPFLAIIILSVAIL